MGLCVASPARLESLEPRLLFSTTWTPSPEAFAEAQAIRTWNGAGRSYGIIREAGAVDIRSFTAQTAGLATFCLESTPWGNLVSELAAYSAEGALLAEGEADAAGDASVSFRVGEGETYYMTLGGEGDTQGWYCLNIQNVPEPFASATAIDLDPLDTESRTGTLASGESVAYAFTAEATGRMYLDATGENGLDPTLSLYTDPHRRWMTNDNAGEGTQDSHLFVRYVREGETYYATVGGADGTAGDYTFTVAISPTDDCGNTADDAGTLRVWGWSIYDYGLLNYTGDVDMKAYTATESGLLTLTQSPWSWWADMTGRMAAYGADGTLLAESTPDEMGDANLSVRVVAGETYYVAFGAEGSDEGYYRVSGTVVPEPFASATAIDLDPLDTESRTGTLASGESVAYAFTAQASGRMDLEATGADGLDPTLDLYHDPRRLWMSNDNAAEGTQDSSLSVWYVREGETYYATVGGADGTAGDYTFTVDISPSDDCGNTADDAGTLGKWGWLVYDYGRVDYAGDVDMKAYTATESGLLTLTQSPWSWWADMTGRMSVYGADGTLLAESTAGETGDANLSVHVVAGETYYVAFGAEGSDQGYYRVSGTVVPEPFASATAVDLDPLDTESRSGTLASGESVAYVFTAGATGHMYLDAAGDNGLDPTLGLYTNPRRLWMSNDNAAEGTQDSSLFVRYVRAGETYYVTVGGADGTAGDYTFTVAISPTDDCGNTIDHASTLRMNGYSGSGTARGKLDYSGDVDVYELTPTESGVLTVTQGRSWWGTPLDGELWIYNAVGDEIAHDATGGGGASVSANVIDGFTYYVKVGSSTNGTGYYGLAAAMGDGPAPDPDNDPFALAVALDVPLGGQVDAEGAVDAAGEVDIFQFTAEANGTLTVDMGDEGGLDAYLRLYNSDRELLAANNDVRRGVTDAQLNVQMAEGETYYVVAGGAARTTGSYDLAVASEPEDDYGNTFADARSLLLAPSGDARCFYGNVDYRGDVDMATFLAAVTGTLTIEQAPWPQEDAYTAAIVLYDADGTPVAEAAPGAAAGVTVEVVAGERYYLRSAAEGDATGRYRLQMQTEIAPDPTPDPDPAPDPDPDPDPAPDPDPNPDIDYTPGLTVVTEVAEAGGVRTLVVLGTEGADPITLSQDGAGYTIETLWGTTTFSGSYAGVEVYGFGGGDTITLEHALTLDAIVYAGDGADTVFEASTGQAVVYGMDGDDFLVTVGGGADTILGGSGVDSFWFDGTDMLADAQTAEYTANSIHRITQFYQPTSSPAQYVSLEIAGQDLVDPTASGTYYDHSYRPLWVDGAQYNDIRQGALGDCYFLAALASLAQTDPAAIHEMIAPMGDGTYAVRYYRNGTPYYLRVDAELPGSPVTPRYAKLTPDGELWVALAEKAYAQFRYGQNSYASLSGGWMDVVYQAVTGQWTTRLTPTSSSTATAMSNYLDAGHGVTAASKSGASSPIVGLHAYMVKDVEVGGDQTYVTVYNPWGVDGRTYDGNYGDGLLRLTWSTFTQQFSAVVVSLA